MWQAQTGGTKGCHPLPRFEVGKRVRVVNPGHGDKPAPWLIGRVGRVKGSPINIHEFNNETRREEARTYYQVEFESSQLSEHAQTSYTLQESWLMEA